MTHEERLSRANALIEVIASTGRRFFFHKGRVGRLERDRRGRIWFIDAYTQKRIYTHYSGRWRGFTSGGTNCALIEALRDYVVHGRPVPAWHFGPWPPEYCAGDLWGYGDDMEKVRAAAELVTAPPAS